jgi:RND family efflux transporter MFP subunit
MSHEKPALDALRIKRRAVARSGRPARLMSALLALALVGAGAAWWFKRPAALAVATAVARAESSAGQMTLLNASGYVTARRSATVSSKVTGKVVEVLVEEGKRVESGEVLARLDASNVEASLRLAEAQLERAKKLMEEIKPNVVFAEQELRRFTDLAKTKAVSDSDLRRAEAEARALSARLVRLETEITVAESEVAGWKQQLDDTVIRAPFGGMVTSKNAQPGEMISPMSVGGFTRTGICTIVDMSSLEIEVDVNENYIQRVQPGLPIEATLNAYPDWKIPAKVIAIIPAADRQKATVKVRIGFEKLDPRILPDMGVKVSFQSSGIEKSGARGAIVVVPRAAVQQAGGRDVVWIVRDGRVERRAVSVAQTTGEESTIAAGLTGGEQVVINPPAALAEGARVTEKSR